MNTTHPTPTERTAICTQLRAEWLACYRARAIAGNRERMAEIDAMLVEIDTDDESYEVAA